LPAVAPEIIGMGRFILFVGMAFVTAFVGVSWAARGFPVEFSSSAVVTVVPLQRTVDRHFGDEHSKQALRKDWEAEHTASGDNDAKRNAIRLDTLQAANAYAMSPCDKTMKANLVEAVTAYTKAWQAMRSCKRNLLGFMSCNDRKDEEAADSVNTPLDKRVEAALHAAFAQKGIVKADFPADVRDHVAVFAGPEFWDHPSPICLPRQLGSAQPEQ
jgi:hypothetical protein